MGETNLDPRDLPDEEFAEYVAGLVPQEPVDMPDELRHHHILVDGDTLPPAYPVQPEQPASGAIGPVLSPYTPQSEQHQSAAPPTHHEEQQGMTPRAVKPVVRNEVATVKVTEDPEHLEKIGQEVCDYLEYDGHEPCIANVAEADQAKKSLQKLTGSDFLKTEGGLRRWQRINEEIVRVTREHLETAARGK